MAVAHPSVANHLLDRLGQHEQAEAGILKDYQRVAKTARDPGVRFLMQLIIEDENRHQRWMSSMATSLRELEAAEPPNTAHPDTKADAALLAKTQEFIEAERQTLDELKELQRTVGWAQQPDRLISHGAEMAAPSAVKMWAKEGPLPVVLEAMVQDTKRHKDILEAIHHRLASSR